MTLRDQIEDPDEWLSYVIELRLDIDEDLTNLQFATERVKAIKAMLYWVENVRKFKDGTLRVCGSGCTLFEDNWTTISPAFDPQPDVEEYNLDVRSV